MILNINIVRYTVNGITNSESPKLCFKRDSESSTVAMDTKITSAPLSIKILVNLDVRILQVQYVAFLVHAIDQLFLSASSLLSVLIRD